MVSCLVSLNQRLDLNTRVTQKLLPPNSLYLWQELFNSHFIWQEKEKSETLYDPGFSFFQLKIPNESTAGILSFWSDVLFFDISIFFVLEIIIKRKGYRLKRQIKVISSLIASFLLTDIFLPHDLESLSLSLFLFFLSSCQETNSSFNSASKSLLCIVSVSLGRHEWEVTIQAKN